MAAPTIIGFTWADFYPFSGNVDLEFGVSTTNATSVTVDWGDGSPPTTDPSSAQGFEFDHTYEADATTYNATITASNGVDPNATAQAQIRLEDQAAQLGSAPTTFTAAATKVFLGIGSAANNTFNATGTAQATVIGHYGNDVLTGGSGSDRLIGEINQDDYDSPAAGNDILTGGAGADFIYGDYIYSDYSGSIGGSDIIRGGIGQDKTYGGDGDDTFAFSAGDVVAGEIIDGDDDGSYGENDEIDTIQLAGSVSFNLAQIEGIEAVRFSSFGTATFDARQLGPALAYDTSVTGSSGANQIVFNVAYNRHVDLLDLTFASWTSADQVRINGTTGSETLTGSVAADTMILGVGDDLANGYDGNDSFDGGAGDDEIRGGIGHDTAVAGSGDDIVYLGSGNDTMKIAATLAGSTLLEADGSDIFYGGSGLDVLDYSQLSSNIILNIENARATSNTRGGTQDIVLDSFHGFESYIGSKSHDTILGSDFDERIAGDSGRDQMRGGGGHDVFDFNFLSDSGISNATADLIGDFQQFGEDIDLSGIDAISGGADNAFTSLVNKAATFAYSATGTSNFTGTGQIITFSNGASAVGADRIIAINTDGDQAAEMMIAVNLVNNSTVFDLTHFVL